jgi:hypothetical protein
MQKSIVIALILFVQVVMGFSAPNTRPSRFDFTGPRDPSYIRGFNYFPANTPAHDDDIPWWVQYDSATTEFDLNLAKSLSLNQVRVFVPYEAYTKDKAALPGKLRHFMRECGKRGIGVMPVVGRGPWVEDTTLRGQARVWVHFLVDAISNEPNLLVWDVMNEPDWPTTPRERVLRGFENCKFMTKSFHELDPKNPVTIGMAFVDGMIEMADYVDVLQFHDYMPTRTQIRDNIRRAKEFAAKVKKPLINGEIGCIARANPYDVTLQEHMHAGVGWYVWELMIVRQGWGPVHGVFYEDGSVRDPSIAAAIMGLFRKRSDDILPAVPDREGWVSKTVGQGDNWLKDSTRTWSDGLNIAETAANLLESAEISPMRVPPSWEVEKLRRGTVNMKALTELIVRFKTQLEPYRLPTAAK